MRKYLGKENGYRKQDKSRRFMLPVVLTVTICVFLSGCIGNFGVGQNVKKLNLSITENRWGREGIYLGFKIVRIHLVSALLDLIVFNSIEFWSGENPITKQPALVNIPKEKLEKIFGESKLDVDVAQIQRINDTEAKMYLVFANGDKMTFDVVRLNDTYSVSYLGRQFYTGQINESIIRKGGV